MTTIGYGDISPVTVLGKAFTVVFVVAALVSVVGLLLSLCFSFISHYHAEFNPFSASCSKLLIVKGFSAILV